jgi:hypothetical protein
VKIATASANIRDPFILTDSGDILEIARWTPLAGHLHAGELLVTFGMVTTPELSSWDLAPTMDSALAPCGYGDYGQRRRRPARVWRRGQNDRCFEGKANLGEEAAGSGGSDGMSEGHP